MSLSINYDALPVILPTPLESTVYAVYGQVPSVVMAPELPTFWSMTPDSVPEFPAPGVESIRPNYLRLSSNSSAFLGVTIVHGMM
jgi:hypothetical protein